MSDASKRAGKWLVWIYGECEESDAADRSATAACWDPADEPYAAMFLAEKEVTGEPFERMKYPTDVSVRCPSGRLVVVRVTPEVTVDWHTRVISHDPPEDLLWARITGKSAPTAERR